MLSFRPTILLAALVARYGLASADCPAAWTDVATDLKSSFITDGDCNDNARAAIRLSFHDCFPGACDGSIILSDECTTRTENTQLVDICSTLGDVATQYDVGVADLIQFAAGEFPALGRRPLLSSVLPQAHFFRYLAFGIASCANGPVISVLVGRTDNSTANAADQIPGANDDAATIVSDFAAKGFSATELVALVGAHTTAKNLNGVGLDDTTTVWDTDFYTETANGTAPASLNSDINLASGTDTSSDWTSFGADSSAWAAAFVPAMEKLGLLGISDSSNFTDCSSVLTDALA
ncbi:putative class II peroxidase [Hypoxylon sp. FL1150]|nr:putative class II peroxidase [Hypoxylon sp. FL1150]